MYERPFFLNGKVSNNAFSFERRMNKKLWVAAIKEGNLSDVKESDKVVFEDYDNEGLLHSCHGLQSFIVMKLRDKAVYVFDNHNHAFSFWHLEMAYGQLQNGATLIHVDQHKDTRMPESFLSPANAQDPQKVFTYTNTVLNVGNFILAAQKTGLIKNIIFLDSRQSLEQFKVSSLPERNIIFDIDLDFFAPEMDYIGNDLKLEVIKLVIPRADVITFATSPYFISPDLAINWLKKILSDFDSLK